MMIVESIVTKMVGFERHPRDHFQYIDAIGRKHPGYKGARPSTTHIATNETAANANKRVPLFRDRSHSPGLKENLARKDKITNTRTPRGNASAAQDTKPLPLEYRGSVKDSGHAAEKTIPKRQPLLEPNDNMRYEEICSQILLLELAPKACFRLPFAVCRLPSNNTEPFTID